MSHVLIQVGDQIVFYFRTEEVRGEVVEIWPAGIKPIGDDVVTYWGGLPLWSQMGRDFWQPLSFDRVIVKRKDGRYFVAMMHRDIQYRTIPRFNPHHTYYRRGHYEPRTNTE